MLLGCTKGERTRSLGKRLRVQAKGNFYMMVRSAYAHDAQFLDELRGKIEQAS